MDPTFKFPPRSEQEPKQIEVPSELRRHINESNLEANFRAYPEMQQTLSPEQQRRLIIITNELLKLPLVHATKRVMSVDETLQPATTVPEEIRTNTFELDQSLGLNQYVFFTWGLPRKSFYGKNFVLASADLLLNPNTLVTPSDIYEAVSGNITAFDKLANEQQENIRKNFFDKMVRGNQWLEIVARRVLKQLEEGADFFTLSEQFDLGEIKFLGPVSKTSIELQMTEKDFPTYYKSMYEHGFAFGHMEEALKLQARTGKWMTVEPHPEDCGIDREASARFWKTKLHL